MKLQILEPDSPLFGAFMWHLSAAGLPIEDLHSEPARYYALEPHNDDARAFGGLVILGSDALLRSVVVPDEQRGHGYGELIVSQLADAAAKSGVKQLYLLTTSAERFFLERGWRTIKREDAPGTVASTRQFSSVCPSSAVLMCRATE